MARQARNCKDEEDEDAFEEDGADGWIGAERGEMADRVNYRGSEESAPRADGHPASSTHRHPVLHHHHYEN